MIYTSYKYQRYVCIGGTAHIMSIYAASVCRRMKPIYVDKSSMTIQISLYVFIFQPSQNPCCWPRTCQLMTMMAKCSGWLLSLRIRFELAELKKYDVSKYRVLMMFNG